MFILRNLFRNVYLLILILWLPSSCIGPKFRSNKEKAEYLTSYETQTLSDSLLPVMMPYNRWIDPAGEQIYFGDRNLENHALDCAVSPDGKWLAVEGRYSVVIISTETKKIVHRLLLSDVFRKGKLLGTFCGIKWYDEEGIQSLYWSTSGDDGKSYVIKANWNNKTLEVAKTFAFEAIKPARDPIPNELVISVENGTSFLYVVLNGNNTLEKINIHTGETVWSVATGVAPFGLSMAAGKLYVTNWAGSIPKENDENVAGVPWGSAKIDPGTGATREGTVSVFKSDDGEAIKEIVVGLHPNDIISSPDEKFVYVANANSDAVSVIHTNTDEVIEDISVRLGEEKNPYWGDSPNGLGISDDGNTLYVANGIANAVAVVRLGNKSATASITEKSRTEGFIPTGAYPGAVCVLNNNYIVVANIESEGSRIPSIPENNGIVAYNSHHQMASVSIIPIPFAAQLAEYTERVEKTNQLFRLAILKDLPRENIAPVPVPVRIGEPSVFKHVVYIIKENRTYDQILGDHPAGDGEPSFCIFGQEITPNTHKICDDFLLMDNYHASGKSSGEGHQWTDMAIVTDYIEKNLRGWFRSYPHVQADALVYAPTGFIWDNARNHGKSVRIYGEACSPKLHNNETWESIYNRFKKGEKTEFTNTSTIITVPELLSPTYPGYGTHKFTDLIRAQAFIEELNKYEKLEGDQWPELMILALPNDHTAGTRPGFPTPSAMVADNDLALGQILEAISKSRFWPTTAVFVTEDDSQGGWDHVSAYRTVGLIASPYSKFEKTIHTNYNQVSMVRTMEQILGLPPMNVMDATAMPMFDCFTKRPDYTPYTLVPNNVPLDEMNKELSELRGRDLYYAKKSMLPIFDIIDSGHDDLFNRIIWFAMKGREEYPAKYSGTDED